MATLQTVLSSIKALDKPINLVLINNQMISGKITDDGSSGDCIEITDASGGIIVVPKANIAYVPR